MTRNKRSTLCLVFTLIGALSFAGPFGIVSCAEGSSFVRIRDGKSRAFLIQKQDVFGMEIGDGSDFRISDPFGGAESHLLTIPEPISLTGGDRTITRRVWPSGTGVPRARQNLGPLRAMAAALIGAGTLSCIGASARSRTVDRDDWIVESSYSAGCIMIGSGSVLAILSLFAD